MKGLLETILKTTSSRKDLVKTNKIIICYLQNENYLINPNPSNAEASFGEYNNTLLNNIEALLLFPKK